MAAAALLVPAIRAATEIAIDNKSRLVFILVLLSFVLIRRPDFCLFAYVDETYLAHGKDCHGFGCSTIGVFPDFLIEFPDQISIPDFPRQASASNAIE
jgi:hypothetical protein